MDTSVFHMGEKSLQVVSYCSQDITKIDSISRLFLHLCSSSLIVLVNGIHFSPIFKRKKDERIKLPVRKYDGIPGMVSTLKWYYDQIFAS